MERIKLKIKPLIINDASQGQEVENTIVMVR